ncbi:WD40-repeat-containing domain protein [Suillus fuscotomentosus]|uniref:WD40-repeat-containing domain protein n=1 Tax=Suillus fuscotomentosus TaxID=1912939 RepID=A0AAD4HL08_9AGAM|nr:WD40-repeat-containing domain protein [Suillus fuscotomentosus]KAG1901560.1 WD40-repeat-containing domain protein [Suillus fuscotomentosus]
MSLFAWSLFMKSTQHFQHRACLSTYGSSIHALAISNDGQALACGGTEGVKLWDTRSRKELTCSPLNCELRGTVSCAVWITTRLGMAETLCYGTGLGYVAFLRHSPIDEICVRRLGSGFEITCMSWDLTSSDAGVRIAIGMRDKIVQVLVLNTNSQLQATTEVSAFGLYNGNFIKLNGDNSTVVKEYTCKSVISHAAINQKRGVFVVNNAADGFTLYRLDSNEEPVRTFVTAPPSVSVPKQVAFGAEGRLIVGGSDNGSVYVFERKTGKLLDTLRHSNGGLVQTIATRDIDGRCTVATASPALGRSKATINLWVHDYSIGKATLTSKDSWSLLHMLKRMFTLLVHLSALALIVSFLITSYSDTVVTWSIDIAQCMRPMHMFIFPASNPPQSAVFEEAPYIQEAVREKSDILILHELAEKLMEVIREAKRDVGEDLHHVIKHDITAEVERVFHQAVQARKDDIRGTRRGQDGSGKEVILV